MYCDGSHGLSIGSVGGKSNNNVTNIAFSDSVVLNSQNGCRIKTNSNTTGFISGISYENIFVSAAAKILLSCLLLGRTLSYLAWLAVSSPSLGFSILATQDQLGSLSDARSLLSLSAPLSALFFPLKPGVFRLLLTND